MRLPILHTDFNQGIVNFCEERDYHLTYILRDYQDNESRYDFTVRGVKDNRVTLSDRRSMFNDYQLFNQCLWPLHERRK